MPFLEKTPVHQVILYNDKKTKKDHYLWKMKCDFYCDKTKTNNRGANKYIFTLGFNFILIFVVVPKEKWYHRKYETTTCIYTFFQTS